jgi:hypothetical protein
VSFHVSAGQKIGICGRSGFVAFSTSLPFHCTDNHNRSGKSSLVMAIFRALDKSLLTGQILINGLDIQSIPLQTLRESLRQEYFQTKHASLTFEPQLSSPAPGHLACVCAGEYRSPRKSYGSRTLVDHGKGRHLMCDPGLAGKNGYLVGGRGLLVNWPGNWVLHL